MIGGPFAGGCAGAGPPPASRATAVISAVRRLPGRRGHGNGATGNGATGNGGTEVIWPMSLAMPVTGPGGLLSIPRRGRYLHPLGGGLSSHPRQLGVYGNGAPIKRWNA